MTDAARDFAPKANPDGRDPNVWSEYEIETQTSLVDRALRTLKHGDAFAVLDSSGDIGTIAGTAEGLFYRDTRYLSHYELRIEGKKPLLLSSSMHQDKSALSVALTNPDIHLGEHDRVPRDTIFLERTKFVWNAACYERVSIKNYDRTRRRLRLDVLFDADFHDLFEVRGTKRRQRGRHMAHPHRPDRAEFHYAGLDGIERRTALSFSPAPKRLDSKRATFEVELEPDAQTSLIVTVACEEGEATEVGDFFRAYQDTRRARRTSTAEIATVATSSELFDEVACRAASDVYTLITRTDRGPYPYAGIPWFSTIFGRDGIITGAVPAVDGSNGGAGCATHARRDPSHRLRSEVRCPAGQDPARKTPWRDGQSGRGAVRALLRHGGCDTALSPARKHVLRAHGRPRDA